MVKAALKAALKAAPSGRAKPPALDPVASVDLVLADGVQLEEAAVRGRALLGHHDATADEGRVGLQQLHEAGRWHNHTVLVGALAQSNRLPNPIACFQPACLPMTSGPMPGCTRPGT